MPPGRRPLSACPPACRVSTRFCEEAFSKQAFISCGATRGRARRSSETSSASIMSPPGIKGFIDLLRREIRTHNATLLVLDGLIVTEESSGSDPEFRKFIHQLQAHIAIEGCTALLLTNDRRNTYHPEDTMVDGLIE